MVLEGARLDVTPQYDQVFKSAKGQAGPFEALENRIYAEEVAHVLMDQSGPFPLRSPPMKLDPKRAISTAWFRKYFMARSKAALQREKRAEAV